MNAYLFDVDGVITDPVKKQVTKPELIEIIARKLGEGIPIAFISGRGLVWLRSRVVKVLENYLDDHPGLDRKMLDLVFVSGEFGGVYSLHENGERKEMVNPDFVIPNELREKLNVKAEEFSEVGFVEHEKQTQFTIEAHSGKNFFDNGGEQIAQSLRGLVSAYPNLTVSFDRIGMNIKHKDANKRYAVRQYLNWLAEKGLKPEKYFVFGDSPSDLEMGEELRAQGMQFEFVFVGNKEDLNGVAPQFQVTFTQGRNDSGTLEFIKVS